MSSLRKVQVSGLIDLPAINFLLSAYLTLHFLALTLAFIRTGLYVHLSQNTKDTVYVQLMHLQYRCSGICSLAHLLYLNLTDDLFFLFSSPGVEKATRESAVTSFCPRQTLSCLIQVSFHIFYFDVFSAPTSIIRP